MLSLPSPARAGDYAAGIMTYYHATTREKLPSIQRLGLGGTRNVQKNFDCPDGVVLGFGSHAGARLYAGKGFGGTIPT